MAQPTYLPPEWGTEYRRPHNGLGVTSLICGITGTFLGLFAAVIFYFVPMGLGLTAVITGIIARKRFNRGEASNGKQAIWGIVLGVVAIVLAFIGMAVIASISHKLNTDLNNIRTGE